MSVGSLPKARLEWAEGQLADCRLCPRQCRVDRLAGETGWCGAGAEARVFTEFVHFGEEAELAPSHTVCLVGCNLRCAFCQTAVECETKPAWTLTPERLGALVARGRREGARNLNLHGGEPTVSLPALLRLFAVADDLPPIVWNTNLYATAETLARLEGLVAVYLVDLKFGNAACAARICGAEDYWGVVRARLGEVWAREPERLIVRHLVLPGHVECCTRPALEWLAGLGRVRVSLKTEYVVMPRARREPGLGRFLTTDETRRAQAVAADLGLELLPKADPAQALAAAADRPAAEAGGPLEAEVLITPQGEIFLRHPTRGMTDAVLALSREHKGTHP